MSDKKILILAMSCKNKFFEAEEDIIRHSWGCEIINNFPNITYFSYSQSVNEQCYIDKKKQKIFVPCNDTIFGTWTKTLRTFRTIDYFNIDYDYIFRTNTSTYINVPLLNDFVQSLDDNDDHIYCGMIDSPEQTIGPYKWNLYAQGNAILLKKKYIDIITDYNCQKRFFEMDTVKRTEQWENYAYHVDDNVIGDILNTYFFDNEINHALMYKDFRFINSRDLNDVDILKYIAISIKMHGPERDPREFYDYINLHNKIQIAYKDNDWKIDRSLVDYAIKHPVVHKIKDGYGPEAIIDLYEYIKDLKHIPYIDKGI